MVKLNKKDSIKLLKELSDNLNKPAYMIPTPKLNTITKLIIKKYKKVKA